MGDSYYYQATLTAVDASVYNKTTQTRDYITTTDSGNNLLKSKEHSIILLTINLFVHYAQHWTTRHGIYDYPEYKAESDSYPITPLLQITDLTQKEATKFARRNVLALQTIARQISTLRHITIHEPLFFTNADLSTNIIDLELQLWKARFLHEIVIAILNNPDTIQSVFATLLCYNRHDQFLQVSVRPFPFTRPPAQHAFATSPRIPDLSKDPIVTFAPYFKNNNTIAYAFPYYKGADLPSP